MSKYFTLEDYQDDIVAVIDAYITRVGLSNKMRYKVIGDVKSKKPVNVVMAQPYVKFDTGIDVYILVNHLILEKLDLEDRVIVIDDELSSLHFDEKSDKVKKDKNRNLAPLVTKKYGIDKMLRSQQLCEDIYNQLKDKKEI